MSGSPGYGRTIRELRSRLVLEMPVDVADDTGGISRSFVTLASLWGHILAVRDADRFIAGRMEITITHAIRLRYRSDVTGAMRLRQGLRIFYIHGVEDIGERHRFLMCQCEEIRP